MYPVHPLSCCNTFPLSEPSGSWNGSAASAKPPRVLRAIAELTFHPPSDNLRDEWVVIIHFDDEKSLRKWLDSPVRSQWVEKLETRWESSC